ncbi:MAG: AAA family ATPase [Methanomassiliicoccales archaeon]|nr:AAA family ATPase [Methanomassiliicoccales archaeon]
MAKRFECPRCGAGVKPGDSQCFRCGESLKDSAAPHVEAVHEPVASASFEIGPDEHIPSAKEMARTISQQAAATSSLSARRPFDEKELTKKEKELAERERALDASALQLEKDSRSLEFALKHYEEDESKAREREAALKEREKELDSLAIRMDEELERLKAQEGGQSVASDDVKHLRELSEDHSKRAIEDRRKQRQQLDREIEEKLERLKLLEGFISLAESHPESSYDADKEDALRKMQEKNQLNESVVKALIHSIDDEIHDQFLVPARRDFDIISTHSDRLNSILGGGIPAGHVLLINGAPGTMKSSLAFHILHAAASLSNKKVMYFSLEQKRASLIRQMERMGMPMEKTKDNMMVIDMVDLRRSMSKDEGDWRSIILRYVKNVHAEMPFDIFVLDSLDSFKSIAQFEFNRQSMKDLFDWFKELKITVLFITERPLEALDISPQGETYLADGVIELLMPEIGDGKVYRWLRCVKMRGLQNDPRYYAFYLTDGEFKFSLPLADTRN